MADEIDLLALFQALADESRLRICFLLTEMELTVGEIAQALGQSQPRVSRHLRILDEAGIVTRRKEGAWTFVTLDLPEGSPVRALMAAAGGATARAVAADARRLEAIRIERAETASRWFNARSEQWELLRALHAPEEEVEAAIVAALAGRPLGRLVDVGTGTGRMLELFAPGASEAVGIDRSPDMLRIARVRLEAAGEAVRASLRQGDMFALPLPDGHADTVILHQVLHFAHQPRAAIDEAARILGPGGRLVLVDFEAHGREELRRDHGHQRLGFADEAIEQLIKLAGLAPRPPAKVAGGELTVAVWTADRPGKAKRRAA
ncbi:ArsR/SmtB family transcription factor [Sphingomicrobium astaxanthinifaciens]|uniref:ArsR/SmtB family transcription factor n=1 Tax=Sphingomicrobium astaxanthinifaciens TaxID=1227949 RepID=UPI001FCAD259|nr:metalloregulator ArsR/SmtB family transcription factor [Sphingomicrobium astaxanthinifaciens]MCJ7421685.1 metalloregulator ArsR/SmtB family transcription factor [Sphingomicrobium astaxanthinifaciens]